MSHDVNTRIIEERFDMLEQTLLGLDWDSLEQVFEERICKPQDYFIKDYQYIKKYDLIQVILESYTDIELLEQHAKEYGD